MANEYTVKLIFDADGALAIKGISQVESKISDFTRMSNSSNSAIKSMWQNFTSLSLGVNQALDAFGKFYIYAQKIKDFGAAGAILIKQEEGFNALAAAAGYSGQAIVNAWQNAAQGVVGASDLMERGGRLMQESIDPVVIEKTISLLKKQASVVGETFLPAYEKYIAAVTTGIMGRGFKPYIGTLEMDKELEKYAETHGKVVEKLSQEEKAHARSIIILKALQDRVGGVSGAMSSYADSIDKSKSQIKGFWEDQEKGAAGFSATLYKLHAWILQNMSGGPEQFWGPKLPSTLKEGAEQLKLLERYQRGEIVKLPMPILPREKEPPKPVLAGAEELRGLEQKKIASLDAWNTSKKLIDFEYAYLTKMYKDDAVAYTIVKSWKANEDKKWTNQVMLVKEQESQKYLELIGNEEGALKKKYDIEIFEAKGNADLITLIRKRQVQDEINRGNTIAQFWIKAHGDQLKEEGDFQSKLADIRTSTGMVSEEAALQAKLTWRQKALQIEKDIAEQTLKLEVMPEQRRNLIAQIQLLEYKIINDRKLGESEIAAARLKYMRDAEQVLRAGVISQIGTESEMAQRRASLQVKTGFKFDVEAVKEQYDWERKIAAERIRDVEIQLTQTKEESKRLGLMSQRNDLVRVFNTLEGKEGLEIAALKYEAQKKYLELQKQERDLKRENLSSSMEGIARLLDLTSSSTDQMLQTLSLGMKQVIESSTSLPAILSGGDIYTQRFERQVEMFAKMEEATRNHQDRERIMEEQGAAVEKALAEKEFSQRFAIASNGFGALAGLALSFYALSNKQSKAALQVYQALAVAQAIIDTYVSAQKAYTATIGIPVVGPYLAPAMAAVAVAAGIARVAAIKSQTFHSGGDVMGSSGSEVSAILQPKEVVIDRTTSQREGGYAGIMDKLDRPQASQDIAIINVLDDSVVESFLTSQRGRKIIRNVMQK
uniref:Putative tail tape measure protein n=1 Tax=viral metagenome TaxID=1070528 RepID=A0A6M3L1E1_9ZZZZ